MGQVNWARACEVPSEFERGVKIVLVHLHPEAEPIDGSGGDGGRDIIVRTSEQLIIYEVKAFADKLTSSRKRQIKRSLDRAAEHSPSEWHLVVAFDHNNAALQWFDALRGQFGFPLFWHGYSWLEAQLTVEPRLRRAFTPAAIEVLELARDYDHERAVVRNVEDLQARFDQLHHLADEFSATHYVSYVPEHPGAGRVRLTARDEQHFPGQATVSFNVSVPAGDAHHSIRDALQRLRDFGDPVTIGQPYVRDASAADEPPTGRAPRRTIQQIELSGIAEQDKLPTTTVTVTAPNGLRLASVPFVGEMRRRGELGARVTSFDLNRTMELVVTVSNTDTAPTLSMRTLNREGVYPHQLVSTVRLRRAMREPNVVAVTVAVPPQPSQPFGRVSLVDTPPADPEIAQVDDFIEGLAALQEAAGDYFVLPEAFSPSQAALVARIRSLVDGETVVWTREPRAIWVRREEAPNVIAAKRDGNAPEHIEMLHPDPVVQVFGRDLHIGPIIISADITIIDDQYLRQSEGAAEYLPVLVNPDATGFMARRPSDAELGSES